MVHTSAGAMIALAVAAASTLAMAYVLVGYPRLLGWLARRRARPVRKAPYQKPVTVVIAVHNGEPFIAAKLDSVLALQYPKQLLEVIVVSDGSTDGTEQIVEGYAARGVQLLRQERGGKPAAVNLGMARAAGEIVVLTDVRQILEPEGLQQMLNCFADPEVGVVSGDLVIRDPEEKGERSVQQYWDYERKIRMELGSLDSIFGATGPYYAIRRSVATAIPPDMLLDDVYLPLHAYFQGYRLVVEPGARAWDYPTTIETEFRRKVRTLAGNYQILQAYPQLLGPGNRMWWHFVSYKLGRLLLPWWLLAIAVASFWMPEPLRAVAIAGQLLGYGLALADRWLPEAWPIKRVTSAARAFVTLVAAAVVALRVFFVPPRELWKVTTIERKPS